MKILLAVDGSPCSNKAVAEVSRRPWPAKSEFKVLTAYQLPLPPNPEAWAVPASYFDELDKSASDQARSVVERAISALKAAMGSDANIKGEALPGPPQSIILEEAESWGADLIVVGSHGYRAWARFLLGSVSHSVVAQAKCSVEVVRCPGSAVAKEVAKEKGVRAWPKS